MYKILLIEDEKLVRDFIVTYFKTQGITVIEAANGYEALDKMDVDYDLILLDIMMPGIDGYEVCKQIRARKETPIIFISALSQDDDQLKAYDIGADDYITKPFKPSLLYAKCIALIKRDKKTITEKDIPLNGIEIDAMHRQIKVDDKWQSLTATEFKLLEYFIENRDLLLTREQLLNGVWGYDYFGDSRAVDTYVKKLRKKLGNKQYIRTIVKSGYIFEVPDSNE